MKFPTLKCLLIILFATKLLCESHMSIYTTILLDLEDALITHGLDANMISSKRCDSLRIPLTISGVRMSCSNL